MTAVVASEIVLTDEQERAMSAVDDFMADHTRQVFSLQGLAGSGKTTVLEHIAHQVQACRNRLPHGQGSQRDPPSYWTAGLHVAQLFLSAD